MDYSYIISASYTQRKKYPAQLWTNFDLKAKSFSQVGKRNTRSAYRRPGVASVFSSMRIKIKPWFSACTWEQFLPPVP